ncbi:hypothetical protein Drorol1_Dr00012560 [Drosera rotundifolia]
MENKEEDLKAEEKEDDDGDDEEEEEDGDGDGGKEEEDGDGDDEEESEVSDLEEEEEAEEEEKEDGDRDDDEEEEDGDREVEVENEDSDREEVEAGEEEAMTPSERSVRERKQVDCYMITFPPLKASTSKPLAIAKGSGAALKDIPNGDVLESLTPSVRKRVEKLKELQGAKAIGEMLKKNSTLRILELNNNTIDYSGFIGLAGALLENKSVHSLHLKKNKALDPLGDDITLLNSRVHDANARGRHLLGK